MLDNLGLVISNVIQNVLILKVRGASELDESK